MKDLSNQDWKGIGKHLDDILKKLDLVVVIMLANAGLKTKEISSVLGVSDRTIQRIIPPRLLKKKEE